MNVPVSDSGRKIIIFDTTLRDGEQSPGASMNFQEKMEVAQMLALLGVDVIEAGFPVASEGDFLAVKTISEKVKGPIICGLSRCREVDILRAVEAIKHAEKARVHIFLATSPIHRQYKLKMSPEQVLEHVKKSVAFTRNYCPDVEFSCEDASRTEPDFLASVVETAISAGASTINIPDTVGYAIPSQFSENIRMLINRVPNIDKAILSVHCHNDLGMAVANTLAAVEAGAGQIECTINGIGERAGNCALEEVVMAIRTRSDVFHAHTGIITEKLLAASRLVSGITGLEIPRNKAIVGRNAFAHESGIHQDGMLKNPTTYEIMRPEQVGFVTTDLVLGKHSGRAGLSQRVRKLGYSLTETQMDTLFQAFKSLADRKKEIYNGDIRTLVQQVLRRDVTRQLWTLEDYSCVSGTGKDSTITLSLRLGDAPAVTRKFTAGEGPIDTAFVAICEMTGYDMVCCEYRVHSVTIGHDAQGEVNVAVKYQDKEYRGNAVSTDCIESSIRAFIDAANRILCDI
ncbi:MAG: 2-isopropylmalate synthase [Planctomycetia bacterium]|nr:2-isopropylmalate synthase [Planctomycetia bacterium]